MESIRETLIVWPPTYQSSPERFIIPENLLQLSIFLEKNGCKNSFIDLNIELGLYDGKSIEDICRSEKKSLECLSRSIKIIEEREPGILCLGGWSSHLPFNLEFAREYKKRNPGCFIIFGGYAATFTPQKLLEISPEIDALVRGGAEVALCNLVKKLNHGENWHDVRGISFRSGSKIFHNPEELPIKNLDSLPFPEPEAYARIKKDKGIPLVTARGCAFDCNFCVTKRLFPILRRHSVGYVIKKIRHYENFGLDFFSFVDETFTTDKKWTEKLCDSVVKNGLEIKWDCGTRVDTVSMDLIKKMSRAGCSQILYGLESINPENLIFSNKTSTPEKYISSARKIIPDTARYLKTVVSALISFPYETKDMMVRDINFMKELESRENIFSAITPVMVFPGTLMWKKYETGEIGVRKMRNEKLLEISPKRRILFSEKYDHIFWCVPELYLCKNETMSQNEMEEFIYRVRTSHSIFYKFHV